ncbi:MAG: hypothetical protein J7574_08330 [Flavobacterium sp.]|uniref:hypothetical protein n=1 Tax=Flavobacterium sp. TaxID=239 RepID=UPI001B190EDA|nr:hypothetical protein [Flavobacterium sp.]MBO9584151.1 hypothetical protein [Flavobacterium sp.]
MVTEQLIFQIQSRSIIEAFATDNYSIEFNTLDNAEDNLCIIYFSSNDIYYPNTKAAFDNSIIKKDRYEWKRNKFPLAKKHIFLRDIRKQWYIGGINSRLDNPHKLLDFLKLETKGYKIYTVGSSAGGYAAILFGTLLKADRVYAFNSQLNLHTIMKNSTALINPILFKMADDIDRNVFFDLSNIIRGDINYYYYQSCNSQIDIDQYNAISPKAKQYLKIIRFKTSNHGFPFLRINLPNVLAFDQKKLDAITSKTFHPIIFSISLIGVTSTFKFVIKALYDRFKKKGLEYFLKYK